MLAIVDSIILNAIKLNIFFYLLSSSCNKFHTDISNVVWDYTLHARILSV